MSHEPSPRPSNRRIARLATPLVVGLLLALTISVSALAIGAPPVITIPPNTTIRYGAPANVWGMLTSADGTDLTGRSVSLYQSSTGSTWVKVAYVPTVASGLYSFTVRPTSRTYYQTRFLGDSEYPEALSPTMTVGVRAYVSTPVASVYMRAGVSSAVHGYLKPKHTSGSYPVRIYKYRNVAGKWRSYGYVKARAFAYGSYTKYVASVRLPYKGRWRLRAYHADAGHVASWSSGYDYVTVR